MDLAYVVWFVGHILYLHGDIIEFKLTEVLIFLNSQQIDSIMSTRLASENDASRRLKSEFLIQFDGVTSNPNDLVIVIGEL